MKSYARPHMWPASGCLTDSLADGLEISVPNLLTVAAVIFVATLIVTAYTDLTTRTNQLENLIMSNTQEVIDAVTAQIVKAQRELVGRIAEVQAQLDAAGVAEQVDLTALTAAAQALDDVVPDPAVETATPTE